MCAMNLGHSISSGDRAEIVKSAKRGSWSSFNIFRADFGHITPLDLKMYYFKNVVLFSMEHPYGSVIMC